MLIVTPIIIEPVSPRKILLVLPKTLKIKKAINAPDKEKHRIEFSTLLIFQNQIPNRVEMRIPVPEARPSMPSIRLNPFIITTNRNIVIKILAKYEILPILNIPKK
jgi:hypothetical protein